MPRVQAKRFQAQEAYTASAAAELEAALVAQSEAAEAEMGRLAEERDVALVRRAGEGGGRGGWGAWERRQGAERAGLGLLGWGCGWGYLARGRQGGSSCQARLQTLGLWVVKEGEGGQQRQQQCAGASCGRRAAGACCASGRDGGAA